MPTTGPLIEPDSLVRIVTRREALGFDYVTISDHIYAHGWYLVGTNPHHPMNTVSTFRQGLERFHGFCGRGGSDAKEITLAYRVLSSPVCVRVDRVGGIRRLEDLGATSVDVRLFGYGEAQSLQGTIDNMHRFRDSVLSKLS